MTRKGIKKHWETFQAWLDGAEIEYKNINGWHDISNPNWDYVVEYRVKPFNHKQGDLILVSNDGEYWQEEVFVKIHDDKFVTISSYYNEWDLDLDCMMINTYSWKRAKPLKK